MLRNAINHDVTEYIELLLTEYIELLLTEYREEEYNMMLFNEKKVVSKLSSDGEDKRVELNL